VRIHARIRRGVDVGNGECRCVESGADPLSNVNDEAKGSGVKASLVQDCSVRPKARVDDFTEMQLSVTLTRVSFDDWH
jgi:hypothetical protein